MNPQFGQPPLDLAQADFLRLRNLLLETMGLFFDDTKYSVVRNTVSERINATGSVNFETYFHLITGRTGTARLRLREPAQSEFNRLIEALVVNETSFFRHKEHFEALRNEVLPRLLRRNAAKRQLRFWSAGCSTGQEPYSLAMLVIKMLEERGERIATGPGDLRGWKVEIVASDISEKVLQVARNGRFRREDLRGLKDNTDYQFYIKRFFNSITSANVATAPLNPAHVVTPGHTPPLRANHGIAYEISPEVSSLVQFGLFNLATPNYPTDKVNTFDLVMCENVMIYFSPEVTRQVIENIYQSLTPGGFLFIGFSEMLWQVSERFRLINTDGTFYYQKPYPGDPPSLRRNRNQPSTGPLIERKLETEVAPERHPAQTDKLASSTEPLKEPPPVKDKLRSTTPLNPSDSAARPSESSAKEPPKNNRRSPVTPPLSDLLNTALPASQPTPNPSAPATVPAWKTTLDEGLGYMELHEFEKAERVLNEALVLGPNEVDVLCAVAQLKVKMGDYDTAEELSRRAIELNSLSESAHLLLAMIYHRKNQIDDAIREFQHTIYINFDSVIAHMRLGDIWDKRNHHRNALREYRNALGILEKTRPDQYIEDLSVEILKQTCHNNIRRLQGPHRLQ